MSLGSYFPRSWTRRATMLSVFYQVSGLLSAFDSCRAFPGGLRKSTSFMAATLQTPLLCEHLRRISVLSECSPSALRMFVGLSESSQTAAAKKTTANITIQSIRSTSLSPFAIGVLLMAQSDLICVPEKPKAAQIGDQLRYRKLSGKSSRWSGWHHHSIKTKPDTNGEPS